MLRRLSCLIFSFLVWANTELSYAQEESIENSVFAITNFLQTPDWQSPWKRNLESSGTGSGFLIGQDLILTNAHVVSNSRMILVNKATSSEAFIAEVFAIGHDSDLAVLKVKDREFYQDLKPIPLGGLPALLSRVRTYGYPVGGQRISRTEGVVSRIEFGTYAHTSADSHLIVQTDSAINPGNSGGPVMQDGKVVGVAFQSIQGLNDVGYFIPIPLVQRFLQDIVDGKYDGVPEMGIITSTLLNRHQRNFYHLPKGIEGVIVDRILSKSSAQGFIQVGDILLETENNPIDFEGLVNFNGHKVNFNIMAEDKQLGQEVRLKIWRQQKFESVTLNLKQPPYSDEMRLSYDELPQYLIFGGLVFMPLNRNLMQSIVPTPALLYENVFREQEDPNSKREQTVVMTRVLPAQVNAAYASMLNFVVDQVNGQKIASLRQLQQVLVQEVHKSQFIELTSDWSSTKIILASADVLSQHEAILERFGIRQGERL